MQFLMTTALLGSLAAMTEASRCKNRPGHHHHHNGTSILPVPTQYSEAPQEASTTTVEISSYAAAPSDSSSSTLAVTEPLVPLVPSSSDTVSAGSSIGTTLSSSTIAASETSVQATSAPAPATSSIETTPSTSSVVPTTSKATSTVAQVTTSSVASTSVESTTSEATSAAVTSAAEAAASEVAIANAPASAEMCADNQDTLLTEWGLVVSNFRVEESSVEGTVCTTYNGMVTLANGQAAVKFTADANLVFDEATINDNKYYSNAGLGANVPSQLSSISSIPASYSWSRTNTTNFRGKSIYAGGHEGFFIFVFFLGSITC